MILPLPLEELKNQLKNLVSKGIGVAIQDLKHYLPSNSSKYNEVIQLEGQLNLANFNQRNGTVTYSDLQVTYNQIRWNLTTLVDSLKPSDFEVVTTADRTLKSKHGSILYQIPGMMELNKEKRCIVRLAFKEEYLLENIELTSDTEIESIRIAGVMEVELLDPNVQAAFAIRTLNSPDQFIDEDDYTEWIFMVKPLLEGIYPLILKVAVIEMKQGKERRREIVLEEMVTITIEPIDTEATFATADYIIENQISERKVADFDNPSPPSPISVKPTILTPKNSSSTFRRYVPILLFLIIASISSWALDVPQEVNWLVAKWKGTEEGYVNYIEKYGEDGRHVEEARFKRALVEMDLVSFEDYVKEYPKGNFLIEARRQAAKLRYEQLLEQFGVVDNQSETTLISEALIAWKNYQTNYSITLYQEEIADRIESLEQILSERSQADADLAAYQKAIAENTVEALQEYLKTYPNGQFVSEVGNQIQILRNSKLTIVEHENQPGEEPSDPTPLVPTMDLDRIAYEEAKTLEALKQYLMDFPNGKYVEDAKKKINALEKQVEEPELVPIYGTLKDSRDGQSYKIVTYNGQTWMAENLNYNAKGSFCYDRNETNCYKYGRLYPWDVAYYACREGWQLPSDKEWRKFVKQFGGCDDDASDGGRAAFLALEGKIINFNIGFGGEKDPENQFQNLANYWTITPYANSNAYYYYFAGSSFQLKRSKSYKSYSFSCRCVKD